MASDITPPNAQKRREKSEIVSFVVIGKEIGF